MNAFATFIIGICFLALGFAWGSEHQRGQDSKTVLSTALDDLKAPFKSTSKEDAHALKYAEEILTQKLLRDGYIAQVDCVLIDAVFSPICKVKLQTKEGGVVSSTTYSAHVTLDWYYY